MKNKGRITTNRHEHSRASALIASSVRGFLLPYSPSAPLRLKILPAILLLGLAVSFSAAAGEAVVRLGFSEFFASGSSRGLVFSEKLRGLNGNNVVISGYMAPPLKPSLDFFVLTLQPMAICPFCDSDASWPDNIVVVYLKHGKTIEATTNALQVTGRLDIGRHVDETTGFVSQIRIYAGTIEHIK